MADRGLPPFAAPDGTRWLAGSGRSGTTWVQDVLAEANGLRPVFEPLHPRVSPIGARFAQTIISKDETHVDLEKFLMDARDGRRNRFWMQYRCQPTFIVPQAGDFVSYHRAVSLLHRWKKFLSELPVHARASMRRDALIKCIWSNLMLGWLSRHCGFRVVLMVRHPGAVVESELRNGWSASSVIDRMRNDPRFHELTGGRYSSLLQRNLSPIEELAVAWLVENQWPLSTAAEDGVTVVHYELLRAGERSEWEALRVAFGLKALPGNRALVQPSQQAALRGSDAASGAAGAPRWQRTLDRQQKAQLQALLDRSEFTRYSMDDPAPRMNCAARQNSGSEAGA